MTEGAQAAFFSYSREDSDFALRVAGDLKAAGASVWLDRLDIKPGDRWDRAVEDALTNCPRMVVILSPASVTSTNVMDEVSFALDERKTVIPVICRDCMVPFRLRRVQYVDFRQDYTRGLQELLRALAPGQSAGQSESEISDVLGQSIVAGEDQCQRAIEQVQPEDEHRKGAEQIRPEEEESKQVVKQTRVYWKVHPSISDQEWLYSIFITSDGKRLWTVGSTGTILKSDDGGKNWSARNSGTENYLESIFGSRDGKRLWAVGEKGTILESDDGGEHWNARNSDTESWLFSICGSRDGKRLWTVGGEGTILESDDGGEHWNARNSGSQNGLESIFRTSDGRRLWTVGEKGTILESGDNGKPLRS